MVKTAHFRTLSSVLEHYCSLINWIWSCLMPAIPVFFQFFFLYVPRLYCHSLMESSRLFSYFISPHRQGISPETCMYLKSHPHLTLVTFGGNLGCENGLYCCDQKLTWGRKGFVSSCSLYLIIEGSQSKNPQQEPGGRNWQRPCRGAAGGFFLMTCSVCSLITLRTTSPGVTLSPVGRICPNYQSWKCTTGLPQANLLDAFPQLRFPLSKYF